MAQIETAKVSPIDETHLIDRLMPKSWTCHHCGRRNKTGMYADEILLETFKYFEHCGCGYVHFWDLKLTDGFKQQVVDLLTGGTK